MLATERSPSVERAPCSFHTRLPSTSKPCCLYEARLPQCASGLGHLLSPHGAGAEGLT